MFISDVSEGGLLGRTAARAWRGMRLISLDGETVTLRTKMEHVNDKFASAVVLGTTVTVRAEYDPWAYRAFDGGDELRTITNFAFQGYSPDLSQKIALARYLGKMNISDVRVASAADAMPTASAAIIAAKAKGEWLSVSVTNYALRADCSGSLFGFTHCLIDFEKIHLQVRGGTPGCVGLVFSRQA